MHSKEKNGERIVQKKKRTDYVKGRDQNSREGYQNRRSQLELVRDSNTIDVNRERVEDRICYVCKKWNHIAKNC